MAHAAVHSGLRPLTVRPRCSWSPPLRSCNRYEVISLPQSQNHRKCAVNVASSSALDSSSNAFVSKPTDSTPNNAASATPSSSKAGLLASLAAVGGLAVLLGGAYLFRAPIKAFLEVFVQTVQEWGPLGYVAYALIYTGLEVLAVPAIPLTMTAGLIFGPALGTVVVSIAATAAATIAFLIARYAARDKVLQWARQNQKFNAIDKVIRQNGFKVVTLLRLSPLLPMALSNYLYGLTSVDLRSYVAGTFLGLLPGTFAYVSAGFFGREALVGEGAHGLASIPPWQIAIGVAFTVLSIAYIGKLAKRALDDIETVEPNSAVSA